MKAKKGKGETKYGKGIDIILSGEEVAIAILAYLTAHNVHTSGAITITVNGKLVKKGRIYVDPSGFAIYKGKKIDGKTGEKE